MQAFLQLFRPMNSGVRLSLWCQLILFVLSAAAYPFDSRLILGVNPWLKPIKFEISVAIFLSTIGLLLAEIQRTSDAASSRAGAANLVGWIVGIAMIVENVLIAFQAMRGVRSHMNYDGAFNTGIFGAMALGVLLNTIALGLLLLLYVTPNAPWRWPAPVILGARLGLVVLIWGSLEGVAMVTRQQHTVGGPDSGGGLTFVNWSTTHGDLRVAHFFAVHAIQIFLVLGLVISRMRLPTAIQNTAVIVFAVLYLFGCHHLFRQAVAGRPFLAGARPSINRTLAE